MHPIINFEIFLSFNESSLLSVKIFVETFDPATCFVLSSEFVSFCVIILPYFINHIQTALVHYCFIVLFITYCKGRFALINFVVLPLIIFFESQHTQRNSGFVNIEIVLTSFVSKKHCLSYIACNKAKP